MNAAGHLRTSETSCSKDVFGLDDTVNGTHGTTPFGDLATVICSYDHTAGYSSNSLSSYFHDYGWRDRINSLVNDGWLSATAGATSQTLGGNYGEATPSDLGMTATTAGGEACAADKDPWPTVRDNTISALSAVEMARRAVQHQFVQEDLKFPGVTWTDVQVDDSFLLLTNRITDIYRICYTVLSRLPCFRVCSGVACLRTLLCFCSQDWA